MIKDSFIHNVPDMDTVRQTMDKRTPQLGGEFRVAVGHSIPLTELSIDDAMVNSTQQSRLLLAFHLLLGDRVRQYKFITDLFAFSQFA